MRTSESHTAPALQLRAGDTVEVRAKSEILATLDTTGRRDALPFMPEMLQYCGKRFTVYKRAHKFCDTVGKGGSRRIENAVYLEGVRCDGTGHGGCQAGCLIFWKEAWLKRVEAPAATHGVVTTCQSVAIAQVAQDETDACSEDVVVRAARCEIDGTNLDGEVFSCQATELPKASVPLAWWNMRQYAEDIGYGNIGLSDLVRGMMTASFNMIIRGVRRCIESIRPRVALHAVDPAEAFDEGSSSSSIRQHRSARDAVVSQIRAALNNLLVEYPHIRGELHKTPSTLLNLEPGELVEIKSKTEIVETLDIRNRNRGLSFDVEMVPYCGRKYRVLRRVDKILDEKTGRMLKLPNSCIILDGVVCRGCLSRNRLFCPRSIYSYWHEVWLRRPD